MSLTLAEYAAAKKLDVAQLKAWGLADHSDARGPYVRIPYFDAAGEEVAARQRFALDGPNRFRWRTGAKPCLYGLDRLGEARAQGFVVIVEGESDCHTLALANVPALGLPGAALWNEARDAPLLKGIDRIFIAHEGDRGGDTMIEWLARSAIRHRAHVVFFDDAAKDPSALYLADPATFKRVFKTKLKAATPWPEIEAKRVSADEARAYEAARAFAQTADILAAFRDNLARAGLVGENRNACVLYLALTSRLLKRPVSVAYKGLSSAGKSHAVDRVIAYFPDEAIVSATSMSEKALIFMEDDLAHKHLVIAEADGAAGEFQEYLIRTLLSENRIVHRTTEKTDDGIVGRQIVKEGPTGLIITTTRVSLHPENETRLISLNANDTREQTRTVLEAVAARGEAQAEVDEAWLALQRWLALGERRVAVPFALPLARLVSDSAVRMRRDFGQVLSLIETHALLHRASRERDAQGRIVATLDDYAAVRALVFDLISQGIAASVPPSVRETVDVVRALGGENGTTSIAAIAAKLALDPTSAARRCQHAKALGFLVNEEARRGKPARYRLGEAMPADVPVLPAVRTLALALGGPNEGERVVLEPLDSHFNGAAVEHCSGAVRIEETADPPPPSAQNGQANRWSARI